MTEMPAPKKLQAKDYATDQEVRWCPGCGDYAILKSVQKTLAELEADPAQTVFVSGIGCSSRFPYYMATYGFHTIHGRAPAIATGVKLANPDLDVWVVTGDGDGLSIGGNHLLHLLRRDVDLQLLLFNNEIYGLTKGQASPTSRPGTRSPSTPSGSLDQPVSATRFALGAGGSFVARTIDTDQKRMPAVLKRARAHRGTAMVEILQNCIVYNDGVFDLFAARDVAGERQLHLEHGQPMIFGAERDKGLRLKPGTLRVEVVSLSEVPESDLLVHDETDPMLATLLAGLEPPFPVAMGVLYAEERPESWEARQLAEVGQATGRPAPGPIQGDLDGLLRSGSTWTVE
ncbi:2-oxoacid:ferredoxin oxidoreductase subunit beta [Aquibaculum arenosum]|uniref:2-oxoacid:ferredoxin oxidoreductase subunit beta n=1 Tax=Aquibaculum arenosum TaxID=3032591 RepID=A0ABT5YKQ5_9PROT|nr:2-oxoacid:ferredoxin oxidoreductase subunit beta [Fodinicurvata sp. CAU 1616]MDF2095411.1 2-oxoacid:ferredoxin oxidoreductase subunit beta [Fodinicurvata sp. CAU 1616]